MSKKQGKTQSLHRKADQKISRLLYPEKDFWRPQVRGECTPCATCQAFRDGKVHYDENPLPCGHPKGESIGHCRPCAFVGCRHNVYLDVRRSGESLQINTDAEPWDVDPEQSCALDLVEAWGPMKLKDIGQVLNVTRERTRQIEEKAVRKLAQTVLDDEEFDR